MQKRLPALNFGTLISYFCILTSNFWLSVSPDLVQCSLAAALHDLGNLGARS
jgi:hypothetical protein